MTAELEVHGGLRSTDAVGMLDRQDLAVLVREYLLGGQLIDRAGMPHIISAFGRDVMGEIAIEEWMGASPIYTPRMQRLLGFVGEDVETIFKGMQFDIGAPPEFMDFRYNVISAGRGEFWLDHCGALMDVEPLGDDYVFTMCHTIEDPTFDATAIATNRRARMSALHRPPREPADRHPHCHWEVRIDSDAEPLPDPPALIEMRNTVLAGLPLTTVGPTGAGVEDDGWTDYRGPLDPDLRLEYFSRPVLRSLIEEIGVQYHLLVVSMYKAIQRRSGSEAAGEIVAKQFIGIAGLIAERLRRAFDLGDSVDALAEIFELHPAFRPRSYVNLQTRPDGDELVIELHDGPVLAEPGTWIELLERGDHRGLNAIAWAVNPRFVVKPIDPIGDVRASWRIFIDPAAGPASEPTEATLAKYSTGANFEFSESPVSAPVRRR